MSGVAVTGIQSTVSATCYTDETVVNVAVVVSLDPRTSQDRKNYHVTLAMPADARDFSLSSKHVCLTSMEVVRSQVTVTLPLNMGQQKGILLRNQPTSANASAPVQLLVFPDEWHGFHVRDLKMHGAACDSMLHIYLEKSPHLPQEIPGQPLKQIEFTVTFRLPAFAWNFYHELQLEMPSPSKGILNTMVRLEGGNDLFIAWLATTQTYHGAHGLRLQMSFVNQALNGGSRPSRRYSRKSIRRQGDTADDASDSQEMAIAPSAMAPRASPSSSSSLYASIAAPDATGRWTIEDAGLRPGGVERIFRGIALTIPLRVLNLCDARSMGAEARPPHMFVLFDKETSGEQRALIEPGQLSAINATDGVVLGDRIHFGPTRRVITVGPLPGIKVQIQRTVDNKADAFHEERIRVTNSRSKDSVVQLHIVQRGAARVEIIAKRDKNATKKIIVAQDQKLEPQLLDFDDEEDTARSKSQGFLIPVDARHGESEVYYRWYEAS